MAIITTAVITAMNSLDPRRRDNWLFWITALLVLGVCVGQGFGWFLGLGLIIREKTIYYSVAQVIALAANTLLSVWLVPRWGAEGAALAVLGGSFVQAVALARASSRFYPFPYRRVIWAAPSAAAAIIALSRWGGLV